MAGLRKLVPWTDRQAIIAAVDSVADGRAQFTRDGPLVLDGEIRDAAARIEPIRRGERGGGADVDAGAAGAATVRLRRVRRQLERGEDRAEKQPRSELPRNKIGVLALPTHAGGGGERFLHDSRGVDEHLHVAAASCDEPTRQRLEPRLDDVVVVVGLGVDGNGAPVALAQDRQRIGVRTIVEPQDDDGARLRPQHARIAPPRRSRCHPFHVAVSAFGQELPQALGRERNRIGSRDADGVEAVMTCGCDQRCFECRRIAQKSRSAYVSDGGIPASVSASSGRNEGRDFNCAYQVFAASSSFHGTSPR